MRTGAAVACGAVALLAAALGIRHLIAPPDLPPEPQAAPAADGVELVADTDGTLEVVEDAPSATLENATAEPPESPAVNRPPLDVSLVARDTLSDAAFDDLVKRLREDPDALAALIEQARAETDPDRLARLLQLLGDVDDPAVVSLAVELVYSGDEAARLQGLDLMKRVRPGDPDVLAAVSTLLSSETEASVLVPTLTALARPGEVAAAEQAGLIEQVAVLSDHPVASVRRTSLDILSRWSDDPTHTPRLLAGLTDTDPAVRRTAAFAFVDRDVDDLTVRRELFAVARDASARRVTRRQTGSPPRS